MLIFYSTSTSKLVSHEGIPANEIWVKVGGDHGGGSMKSTFQILNVDKPNSVENTVVWNLFLAGDSYKNLRRAMAVNSGQVDTLDNYKWK